VAHFSKLKANVLTSFRNSFLLLLWDKASSAIEIGDQVKDLLLPINFFDSGLIRIFGVV